MPQTRKNGKRQRARYRFTKKDCQRGYRAALAKCSESWELLAWFTYRVRGFYRKKKETV